MKTILFRSIAAFTLLFGSHLILAHVKWFSQFDFEDEPLQIADITNSIFWILAGASLVVVGLMTLIDKKIELAGWYKNIIGRLDNYSDKSVLIMRIAAGVVLLMSWELGTLVMPELAIKSELLLWLQFLLAFLLIFKNTVPWAGIGMAFLYAIGVYQFGILHMLDYLLILGVAYYFITSNAANAKLKNTGLFALYVFLGLSLCWAGMEKLFYPHWGTYLLEQYPQLSLGVEVNLFVQGAAFIEIAVGVMFIFCYFQRILAVVVTLLFILTSLVFGSKEIVGHLMIHASLIIFLIEGSGKIFESIPSFYRRFGRNPIFAGLGFLAILFLCIVLYSYGANTKYNNALKTQSQEHVHNIEISDIALAPQVELLVKDDKYEGWNLEIKTQNFEIQPPGISKKNFDNTGYAVISINNELIARMYSNWYYLPPMDPGTYNIELELRTGNHEGLTHLGMPIKATQEIIVE